MSHPPPNTTNKIFVAHNTNARHTAGRFYTPHFSLQTHTELTKVNKVPVINLKPISCKHTIFPTVKPGADRLNKISVLGTHKINYRHLSRIGGINITCPAMAGLSYYRINNYPVNQLSNHYLAPSKYSD